MLYEVITQVALEDHRRFLPLALQVEVPDFPDHQFEPAIGRTASLKVDAPILCDVLAVVLNFGHELSDIGVGRLEIQECRVASDLILYLKGGVS